jgi:hypothetical protein
MNTIFLEEQMRQVNERGFVILNQVYEESEKTMYEAVMRDFKVHPEKWIDYSDWIAGGCRGPMYKNVEIQRRGLIKNDSDTNDKFIDFKIFDNGSIVTSEEY